jgi:hypothetical protein
MAPGTGDPLESSIDGGKHFSGSGESIVALGWVALRSLVEQICFEEFQIAAEIEDLRGCDGRR